MIHLSPRDRMLLSLRFYVAIDRQMAGKMDRQIDRQTDRQTEKEMDRGIIYRQRDRWINRWMDGQIEIRQSADDRLWV